MKYKRAAKYKEEALVFLIVTVFVGFVFYLLYTGYLNSDAQVREIAQLTHQRSHEAMQYSLRNYFEMCDIDLRALTSHSEVQKADLVWMPIRLRENFDHNRDLGILNVFRLGPGGEVVYQAMLSPSFPEIGLTRKTVVWPARIPASLLMAVPSQNSSTPQAYNFLLTRTVFDRAATATNPRPSGRFTGLVAYLVDGKYLARHVLQRKRHEGSIILVSSLEGHLLLQRGLPKQGVDPDLLLNQVNALRWNGRSAELSFKVGSWSQFSVSRLPLEFAGLRLWTHELSPLSPVSKITRNNFLRTVLLFLLMGSLTFVGAIALHSIERKRRKVLAEKNDSIESQRRLERQLAHTDRLVAMGTMMAGIAHEIKNPLTAVLGFTQLLRGEVSSEVGNILEQIYAQALKINKILSDFLLFGRQSPPSKSLVDLAGIIEQVLSLNAYELRRHSIEVSNQLPPVPAICGEADELRQVFLNLILNAQQAIAHSRRSGQIRVRAEVESELVRVLIADNGPGVPLELYEKIFEAFFTTKPPGEGTGLGLSICYGIVKRHQGSIWVQKASLGGAEFVVELPIARSACPAPDPPSTSSEKVEIGSKAGAVRVDWGRISHPRITHVENPSGR